MATPAVQNAANPAPTPFEHKLVKFDLEGHFHYTFTVDLELDLTDPKLDKKFKLEGVALAGEWPANPQTPGKGYGGFRIDLSPHVLETVATTSSGRFDAKKHRSYRLTMEIYSRGSEPTADAKTLMKRMPGLDLTATPHNVRLFFPTLEIDLWSESSVLTRSSSYFETLFASGFDETRTICSGVHSTTSSAASPHVGAEDFEDSDRETDELFIKKHPIRQHSGEVSLAHKQVNVTRTAFTTYRAVLAYLRTGFIAFAPLSSTFPSGISAPAPTRISKVTAAVASDPSLP
ncbi:hypothetical protein JCM10296v2_004705 [Rhodotorula toruloides]